MPWLFLLPTITSKGTVIMFDLLTIRIFSADRFDILPTPDLVIQLMIKMWEADQPRGRRSPRAAWQLGRNGPDYVPVVPPDPQREAEALALIVPGDPPQNVPHDNADIPELVDDHSTVEDEENPAVNVQVRVAPEGILPPGPTGSDGEYDDFPDPGEAPLRMAPEGDKVGPSLRLTQSIS